MRITACLFAFIFLFPALSCTEDPVHSAMQNSATNSPGEKPVPDKETLKIEELFSKKIADCFVWPTQKKDKTHSVCAAAKGLVVAVGSTAEGKTVCIQHQFIENAQLQTVISVYSNLTETSVINGDEVKSGQIIGKAGSKALVFGISAGTTVEELLSNPDTVAYAKAKEFVKRHAKMLVPANEAFLMVAIKHEYKMHIYKLGKLVKTYDIALSQSPLGHKQTEGDNKLPEGEYRIIQKTKGPFAGDYAEYLGPRFMRLNYPNNYDAENALKNKKITTKQAAQIISANNAKKEPNKNTGLGGGIGIHGWAGDWLANSRHLTWGCISMKNTELTELFDDVPLYTQMLILP